MAAPPPAAPLLLLLASLAARAACLQQERAAPAAEPAAQLAADDAAETPPPGCFPTILQGWGGGKPSKYSWAAAGRPLHLVLVGNSMADGIGDAVAAMAEGIAVWSAVQVDTVAPENFSLEDHMAAAKKNSAHYVPNGTMAVLFQEQSQVPGFFDWSRRSGGLQAWNASLDSVRYFADLTKKAGITMALLENWGYQDGDHANAIYPTYDVMQNLLTKGTRVLEAAAEEKSQGTDVHVVPIGEVFRRVQGRSGADFQELFWSQQTKGRRKFLSKSGKWLAAAVIVRSLTGAPPAAPADDDLKARLIADVPSGSGPCDGNPQFAADYPVTQRAGGERLRVGPLVLLLGALAAMLAPPA